MRWNVGKLAHQEHQKEIRIRPAGRRTTSTGLMALNSKWRWSLEAPMEESGIHSSLGSSSLTLTFVERLLLFQFFLVAVFQTTGEEAKRWKTCGCWCISVLYFTIFNISPKKKITNERPPCDTYPSAQIENYFSLLSRKSSITLQTMSRLFSCLPSALPVEDDGREQFL